MTAAVLALAAALAWAAPAWARAPPAPALGCGEARLRCAYRTGCGHALNTYMLSCADVMAGPARVCPERCQHAIIALTSTEEGKALMNCQCEEDDYCEQSKSRVDVCRGGVLQTAQNATISCRLSQLICAVDSECATALEYYHRFCRSMFHGKKCSHKCLNSINILRKQKKAEMLEHCQCDGLEDFDCLMIQTNMARLCFRKRAGEARGGGGRAPERPAGPAAAAPTTESSSVAAAPAPRRLLQLLAAALMALLAS